MVERKHKVNNKLWQAWTDKQKAYYNHLYERGMEQVSHLLQEPHPKAPTLDGVEWERISRMWCQLATNHIPCADRLESENVVQSTHE